MFLFGSECLYAAFNRELELKDCPVMPVSRIWTAKQLMCSNFFVGFIEINDTVVISVAGLRLDRR